MTDIQDRLEKPHESLRHQIFDLVRFIIIALAIVIPLRIFIAQPFIVNGESMSPTFENGQYLIVDQLSYRFGHPQRGDVVIFRPPVDETRFYIKRVIGIPGDTLHFENDTVTITNTEHPEGLVLKEPYISHSVQHNQTITLEEDAYFVMGDNRPNSSDSRYWGILHEDKIIGRAWLRLIPLSKIHFHPGNYRNSYESNEDPEA